MAKTSLRTTDYLSVPSAAGGVLLTVIAVTGFAGGTRLAAVAAVMMVAVLVALLQQTLP